MQNPRVLVVALLVSMAQFAGAVCYSQTASDAVANVPQQLRALTLGMPVADAQRIVGDSKSIGAPTDPKFALFVYFKAPETWDAAMLEFVSGRLASINLLLGVAQGNTLEKSERTLMDVIGKNGAMYRRVITLNSSMRPVPGYVWDKDNAEVFAVGPSIALRDSTRELVPADPSFRVGVTRKGRPIQELVQPATDAEIRDFLFSTLSPARQK
jgi:hypothetical protein